MSSELFPHDLRLYLRAWERHHVHFGVVCSGPRLPLCSSLFPTVCIELSSQREPPPVPSLPDDFVLAGAVSSETLVYRFPHAHHNMMTRGKVNHFFLDPGMTVGEFSRFNKCIPRLDLLIIPLRHIERSEGVSFDLFLRRLDDVLAALPRTQRYAVEIRNSEYLLPEYFECLRYHGVAHVLNDNAGMPALIDHVLLPHVLTAGHVVVRTSVDRTPEVWLGLRESIHRCIGENRDLYLYLDEHEERESFLGSLMPLLNGDLAKLSPIRKKAA
jgi:hypothetical protein